MENSKEEEKDLEMSPSWSPEGKEVIDLTSQSQDDLDFSDKPIAWGDLCVNVYAFGTNSTDPVNFNA